jgi:hypothetical protein
MNKLMDSLGVKTLRELETAITRKGGLFDDEYVYEEFGIPKGDFGYLKTALGLKGEPIFGDDIDRIEFWVNRCKQLYGNTSRRNLKKIAEMIKNQGGK